jgi:hypothetical protein
MVCFFYSLFPYSLAHLFEPIRIHYVFLHWVCAYSTRINYVLHWVRIDALQLVIIIEFILSYCPGPQGHDDPFYQTCNDIIQAEVYTSTWKALLPYHLPCRQGLVPDLRLHCPSLIDHPSVWVVDLQRREHQAGLRSGQLGPALLE